MLVVVVTVELLVFLREAFDTSMWSQQLWFKLTGSKVPVDLVIDSNGTSQMHRLPVCLPKSALELTRPRVGKPSTWRIHLDLGFE
jgi:hypothetical protein